MWIAGILRVGLGMVAGAGLCRAQMPTHLEITVPRYASASIQPRVGVRNIELTAAGQRVPVKKVKAFPTHLLILFEGSAPRPADADVVKKIHLLFKTGWKVSMTRASDKCPTRYTGSPAKLLGTLSARPGNACFPGNAVAHLQSFAGRRVLFLVGSDQDTEVSYDLALRMIPGIYRIDGGVLGPLYGPVSQAFSDNSDQQPQTKEGSVEHELNLLQAVNDAWDAGEEFYDFLVIPAAPVIGELTLRFRNMPSTSFKIDLYQEKAGATGGSRAVQRAPAGVRLTVTQ